MKLTEIAAQKAGSQSGVAALLTFYNDMQRDDDALDAFLNKMAAVSAEVISHKTPTMVFDIQPHAVEYAVSVHIKSSSEWHSAQWHSDPIEKLVTFYLPASAAIIVAVADDPLEALLELFKLTGKYNTSTLTTVGDLLNAKK